MKIFLFILCYVGAVIRIIGYTLVEYKKDYGWYVVTIGDACACSVLMVLIHMLIS